MKSTLLLTVLLAASILAHAQVWPCNPQTGKLELQGMLPWPDTVKTEAQRRLLIRHWHFAKLTEETPAEAKKSTEQAAYYHQKLTYDRLSQSVYYTYQPAPDRRFSLSSEAQLTPTAVGLVYRLIDFEVGWFEEDAGGGFQLEVTPNHLAADYQQILSLLQKRLDQALTGW